jgi:hypothetical protein
VLPNLSTPSLGEAVRQWQAAEQRLYPAAMGVPEAYERYVALVRAVADDLAEVRDPQALADAYLVAEGVVATAARRRSISTQGLQLEMAAGAAFCIRYREIMAEVRREEVARRVEAARAGGNQWVTIQETQPGLGGPFPPWRRLEMHLPEGTGLHIWMEESLEHSGVEYGVEVVPLDPGNGQWLAEQPVQERRTFTEHGLGSEAVEDLRARCEEPVASEL